MSDVKSPTRTLNAGARSDSTLQTVIDWAQGHAGASFDVNLATDKLVITANGDKLSVLSSTLPMQIGMVAVASAHGVLGELTLSKSYADKARDTFAGIAKTNQHENRRSRSCLEKARRAWPSLALPEQAFALEAQLCELITA